jgi:hypothetical protein
MEVVLRWRELEQQMLAVYAAPGAEAAAAYFAATAAFFHDPAVEAWTGPDGAPPPPYGTAEFVAVRDGALGGNATSWVRLVAPLTAAANDSLGPLTSPESVASLVRIAGTVDQGCLSQVQTAIETHFSPVGDVITEMRNEPMSEQEMAAATALGAVRPARVP